MRIHGLCAALALSFLATAAAGQTFEEKLDRFRLFAGCGPMWLVVEDMTEDAAKIGLTKEALRAAAESRLRAARLYSTTAETALYINVLVMDGAFGIKLQYNKQVFDPLSLEARAAAVWERGSIGTHGGDSGYILSVISQFLDQFLVEYLRVNEEACGKR